DRHGPSQVRVRAIRFEGSLAFEPDALRQVLKDLKSRRMIPRIWTRRPIDTPQAVEADLARLRSFYLAHGYFDARVAVGGDGIERGGVVLTVDVQSGPRYWVHRVEVDGIARPHGEMPGEFPVADLCSRLLDARHHAESRGELDFAVSLEVSPVGGPVQPD